VVDAVEAAWSMRSRRRRGRCGRGGGVDVVVVAHLAGVVDTVEAAA
jgi:hypothetical protein